MQKTLKGLLQGLLYDILRRVPRLARDIFPSRWQETESEVSSWDNKKEWLTTELCEGIRAIARDQSLPLRVCFFIDGLDEYDGDHFELCQLLKDLSSSETLKCCVSSRPWNVFDDAFAGDPAARLCMHDLTFQDIRNYTESHLRDLPTWKEPCIKEKQAADLIDSITDRAQGVFLWVVLVTRALRQGSIDGDTIEDMQRRIDALPTDLEPFFKHMLDIVDPFHHRYMARTLQMTINAKGPLHLLTYYVAEYEEHDAHYALERRYEPELVLNDLPRRHLEPCYRRINARCGGLLEFKKNRIELLHRTVRDFLLTAEMQDYLQGKVDPGYKVNLSTLKALAFQLRCILPAANTLENMSNLEALWADIPKYADGALEEDEEATVTILETAPDAEGDFERANACSIRESLAEVYLSRGVLVSHSLQNAGQRRGLDTRGASTTSSRKQIGPALHYRLLMDRAYGYFITKLRKGCRNFDFCGSSLLHTLMDRKRYWTTVDFKMVSELLYLGCDPNEKNNSGDTPWERFIATHFIPQHRSFMSWDWMCEATLVYAFLRNGADRNCRIKVYGIESIPFTHWLLLGFRLCHVHLSIVIDGVDKFLAGSKKQNVEQLNEALLCLTVYFTQNPYVVSHFRSTHYRQEMVPLMERIIAECNKLGIDLEDLVHGVKNFFSDADSQMLVAVMQNSKPEEPGKVPALGCSKRPQDSQAERLPQIKKVKTER